MRLFVIKAAFPNGERGANAVPTCALHFIPQPAKEKSSYTQQGGKCSQKETANLCLKVVAEAILNTPEKADSALKIYVIKWIWCLFSKASHSWIKKAHTIQLYI